MNSVTLSFVQSQAIAQTYAAHLVSVPRLGCCLPHHMLGWAAGPEGRLRLLESSWEKLVETGREAEKQPDRHMQSPAWGGTGLLRRGRGCWAGRKQLLLGTWEVWRGGFGNPVSEQRSVTQEQERAKGLSASCEDRVGRRRLVYQPWHLNLSRSLLL